MKIRCQCVSILAKRELNTAEPSAKQYNAQVYVHNKLNSIQEMLLFSHRKIRHAQQHNECSITLSYIRHIEAVPEYIHTVKYD